MVLVQKTNFFYTPLPWWEGMKGRGKTPKIISTLTPALSRQRERGSIIFSSFPEVTLWSVGDEPVGKDCPENKYYLPLPPLRMKK
jgi:hypothetical protein